MRRLSLIIALLAIVLIPTMAGGLLTNTNHHAAFVRNLARDATTEIDAVVSNPAGTAFLPEGFHFSFNNQSAFQTRTIKSTFAPFVGFGGNETKEFKGETSVPIIPSFQAAYKKGDWTFSGSFAITGGGGKATFNRGLGSFETPISMLPAKISSLGIATNKYSVESFMDGKQFVYGFQIGGAYKLTENLSTFGGFRLNYVNNGYIGHLRNIKINPIYAGNPTGNMISAKDFFTSIGQPALADQVADKELDCEQTGWGITPIIGINYQLGNLNLGAKYEFITSLNVENQTKIDNTGLFTDGVNTPHDIPAMLAMGAKYDFCPSFRASIGYHHFFDKQANMAKIKMSDGSEVGKQKFISHGTHEFLAGAEYDINEWILVSAGAQKTSYGVQDNYQTDMSFSLSSYTFGFGGAIKVTPKAKLNIGYFVSDYKEYTKEIASYGGTGLPGKDVFNRTNKVFAVGIDYSF